MDKYEEDMLAIRNLEEAIELSNIESPLRLYVEHIIPLARKGVWFDKYKDKVYKLLIMVPGVPAINDAIADWPEKRR